MLAFEYGSGADGPGVLLAGTLIEFTNEDATEVLAVGAVAGDRGKTREGTVSENDTESVEYS